jgi:hypothetical protein
MTDLTFNDRLALLKDSLLAVPPQKLIDILIERAVYDDSLRTFLEVMTKLGVPGGPAADLFESAKSMITKTYGTDDLNYQDASDYQLEIYSVHSVLEQIFEKGQYQQVIDLMHWSLQFEENLAGVSWPDDFIDNAFMPLAILGLKSHLRLGKTPAEVAKIFLKMGEDDEYGLFYRLPYLPPGDEAELAAVKKILESGK